MNSEEQSVLKEKINALKKEKNAVIFAHYYTRPEIQEIADFIGDSLALAQQAARVQADILVMCGVHFMGETMKILCPDKSRRPQAIYRTANRFAQHQTCCCQLCQHHG